LTIETTTKQSIILGAVGMTGAMGDSSAEWDARFMSNVKRITTLLSDGSAAAKTIDMLSEAKKFVGTICYVGKEKTSKRGFVVIKTGTDRDEHGLETVRTEIVEGNESVNAFAKDLRENMIGHRVLLYVEMQTGKTADKKFRILQYVEDLGEDTSITEDDLENARARAAKDMKR
jgi:hypothetical protein